jgi:twitching motility protein PilU
MTQEHSAHPILDSLLNRFIDLKGSDLYLTVGRPPSVRAVNNIIPLGEKPLTDEDMDNILAEMLDEDKLQEFRSTMELNMPMPWNESARFRINVFRQQQHSGVVIRRIQTEIPTIESLTLPKVYSELIMESRGLILVVGPTGSGKSTSLAAMIGHRNQNGYGHIVTIEDPIEFVHQHGRCIITQRDVGVDTYSFGMALKNALRQRPDVVLIGEIRDRETMEHAIHFSETGHLCVATLHAGNSMQAMERMINFFPEERHTQIRHSLAHNLRGILSQRLVLTQQETRAIAVEVMLNRGLIRNLIQDDKVKELGEIIAKNRNEGMQTFDQALYQLYIDEVITEEVALAESDNYANLGLLIRQHQNTKRLGGTKVSEITLMTKPSSSSAF